MDPGGPGRCFKSFLEAVPFILTEYEPVASHGHPMAARARKTHTIHIYIYIGGCFLFLSLWPSIIMSSAVFFRGTSAVLPRFFRGAVGIAFCVPVGK